MNNKRVLLATFYLGQKQYALRADAIVEIAPLATFEAIPKAPEYVAGLLHFRNRIVPVIDLRRLIHGQPCAIRMSTRIMLVHYPSPDRPDHVLGLLVERATDTVHKNFDDLMDDGIDIDDAPFLGDVYKDISGLIRCLEIGTVLPDSLKERLFQHERWSQNKAAPSSGGPAN